MQLADIVRHEDQELHVHVASVGGWALPHFQDRHVCRADDENEHHVSSGG